MDSCSWWEVCSNASYSQPEVEIYVSAVFNHQKNCYQRLLAGLLPVLPKLTLPEYLLSHSEPLKAGVTVPTAQMVMSIRQEDVNTPNTGLEGAQSISALEHVNNSVERQKVRPGLPG